MQIRSKEMNKKRNNHDLNETNVKYVRNENIALVTGDQVQQFYAAEDRDSYKVERVKLFQNNPTPQHHSRYMLEPKILKKSKSNRSTICGLSSKGKKLISYCLIYVLMFTCAITLLYLFYTPKQMNLFGFYTNNNLRLKFYRFVLGTNGTSSTTITPKIITTTEPTIFITHSSTIQPVLFTTSTPVTNKIRPYLITQSTVIAKAPSTTTAKSNSILTTEIDRVTTPMSESDELTDISVTQSPVDINVSTEPSINQKSQSTSMKTTQSTPSSLVFTSTKQSIATSMVKSKITETLKKNEKTTIATTVPTTILPRDNSTETLDFNEKFSYPNTQQNSMDKNETAYDETIVDNGVLPTEEEEEERKKDELESKQKIASFFGVDPVTGKEKSDKGGFLSTGERPVNKLVLDTDQKQSNTWFPSVSNGNQQFIRNREFTSTKSPKDDEYNTMLKLLYGSCYGRCN